MTAVIEDPVTNLRILLCLEGRHYFQFYDGIWTCVDCTATTQGTT